MLYLDKCWRELQLLLANPPRRAAQKLVDGQVTHTHGGWISHERALSPAEVKAVAADVSDLLNGSRAAVILGADDFDSLLETIAILSDSKVVADLERGLTELESRQTVGPGEVRAALLKAKRLDQ